MTKVAIGVAGLAYLGILILARSEPEVRVRACGHRHPTPGIHSTLNIAGHPRGVMALVEVCNATSSAIQVNPGGPFLLWEAEPVPPYLGHAGGDVLRLPPGKTLRFDVELTERYGLRPKEYYQCRYAATIGGVETRSEVVGFTLRLTD
jgi:hypothetical protein